MADHERSQSARQFVLDILREPGAVPQHLQVVAFDHPPTDDDFTRPVDAQHVVIDTDTPALWARIGGVWLSTVLA